MKELIITNEDINLLKEMKDNCLKASIYEDEKRLLKANAITKFLVEHEENQQLKEQVEYLRRSIERKESTISEMEQERIPYTNEYVKHLEQQLQQKEDIIYKIKKCIEEKEEYYGDYMGDGNYTMYSMMDANNNRIPYIKSNLIKQILDNKGE